MQLKKIRVPFQWGVLDQLIYHWEHYLGEEFVLLERFLYPTDELSTFYPFDPQTWHVGYKVKTEPDGRIVGVVERYPHRQIELTKRDIIEFRFDLNLFRREMGEGFGLKSQTGEIEKWDRDIPWGTWEPEKGMAFPILLFLGCDGVRTFRERVMERMFKREAVGEIILTPGRSEWTGDVVEAARKNKLLLVPLDEIIKMEDGKLLPTPEWNEYLTAFCKMVEMDLPSTLRKKPEGNIFAKRGEWMLRFTGKDMTLNGALQGPAFVRRLMMTPHREVHVEQLWKEVFGNGQGNIAQTEEGSEGDWNSFLSSGEEILDAAGKTDYRNRLLQLSHDRAEAESENDGAWLERIDAETEAISTRLLKTVDGKGRSRKIGDEKDKLRKRISKNITKAITMIGASHRELAEHLKSSIMMGEYMVYRPSGKVEWSFE